MVAKRVKTVPAAYSTMRGLIPLPDRTGYTVDLSQVKPSNQSFAARGFWTLIDDGEFVATFGWKPRSLEIDPDKQDRFDLAVAFSLAVESSLQKLVDSCWNDESLRKGKTFAESLKDVLLPGDEEWAERYECRSKLPKNRDTAMREFPATVVSATLWNGRGYLEFLDISSAAVRASHDGRARDSDPVHSLAFVVMPPKLLYAFLIAAKRNSNGSKT
jgi:hypothetical protein